MVTFTLNGQELEVKEGTTILEVAREQGIPIPTLCYHEEMSSYGACRLCLVEVIKRGWASIQPACLYPAQEGIEVNTDTERVRKNRKILLELYLARSPDSQVIVDLAREYGVRDTRFKLKENERSDCILCGLCVRACAEISKRHAISFSHRGSKRQIYTPFGELSETCVGCQACAFVCPTGVIKIDEAD
jgi:NADH dehydrogenase/NADH:ubiquinone oxidoreductase subunit G